jgi:C4-type Zn-finger protein
VEQQADGTMEFPKYDVCRMKVNYLIELLQTYSRETRSFKDIIEEPYGTSTVDSEPDLAEEVKH